MKDKDIHSRGVKEGGFVNLPNPNVVVVLLRVNFKDIFSNFKSNSSCLEQISKATSVLSKPEESSCPTKHA